MADAPTSHADDGKVSSGNVTLQISSSTNTVDPGGVIVFKVDVGCALTSCGGGAEMTLTLPSGLVAVSGASAPAGATISVDGANSVITLHWTVPLVSTAWTLAAQLPSDTPVSIAGNTVANVRLVTSAGGADGDGVDLTTDSNVFALNVPQTPAVTSTSGTWSGGPVGALTGATTNLAITGTQGANLASALTFTLPDGDPDTSGGASNVAVFEAFDLAALSFSGNPGGAIVTFKLADGTNPQITVDPGTTAVAASITSQLSVSDVPAYLATVKGFSVAFQNVPQGTALTVTAQMKLRDNLRSNPSAPVYPPLSGNVVAQAVASVVSTTPNGTKSTPTTSKPTITINSGTITVNSYAGSWTTASGDNVSVWGTTEAANLKTSVANTTDVPWTYMTITAPYSTGVLAAAAEQVTGPPALTYPSGSKVATMTYSFSSGTPYTVVAAKGSPAPGLSGDPSGRNFSQVTQVSVTFYGGDATPDAALTPDKNAPNTNGSITSKCSGATDATCAAQVEIPTALRTTANRPPNNSGYTTLTPNISISVMANTGASGQATNVGIGVLYVVTPQYKLSSTKTLGGSQVTFALSGYTGAGDFFNTGSTHITPHDLTFAVTSKSALPSGTNTALQDGDNGLGPVTMTISDPSDLTANANIDTALGAYLTALKSANNTQFFDIIRFTAVPTPAVTCDDGVNAAFSTATAYVLDSVTAPTKITAVSLLDSAAASGIDPAAIVGVRYELAADNGRFPVDSRCVVSSGAVQWRETRLSDGKAVTPALATSGALARTNTADVRSEMSDTTYTPTSVVGAYYDDKPAAKLALGSLVINYGSKSYATDPITDANMASLTANGPGGAASSGVEGQGQVTSFLLSASTSDTKGVLGLRLVDGSLATQPGQPISHELSGFNVFALTKLRGAYIGPDQVMTVKLYDMWGQVLYTAVISGTALTAAQTDPANPAYIDLMKPASANYGTYLNTPRQTFTWYTGDSQAAGNKLANAPAASSLAAVGQLAYTLTRTDLGTALPSGASTRLIIDSAVRDFSLTDLTPIKGAPINDEGTSGGVIYANTAQPSISKDGTTYVDQGGALLATFILYAPTEPFVSARIDWTAANHALVAGAQTSSTISLRVFNDSGVNVGTCPTGEGGIVPSKNPELVWQCPGRLDMGVDTLSAYSSIPKIPSQNVFQILDFTALTSVQMPKTMTGGQVRATLTYVYTNGTEMQASVTGASGALLTGSSINGAQSPTSAGPVSEIIGIWVVFQATDGAVILSHAASDPTYVTTQAGIAYSTSLRTNTRQAYPTPWGYIEPGNYCFSSGHPGCLEGGGINISGPDNPDVPQVATVWMIGESTAHSLYIEWAKASTPEPTDMPILQMSSAISLTKAPGASSINRDEMVTGTTTTPKGTGSYDITVGNDGNSAVGRLGIADDACLFNADTSADFVTQTTCPVTAGSFFDSFNLTSIELVRAPKSVLVTGVAGGIDSEDVYVALLADNGQWYLWNSTGLSDTIDSGQGYNVGQFRVLNSNSRPDSLNPVATPASGGNPLPVAMVDDGLGWQNIVGFQIWIQGRGSYLMTNNTYNASNVSDNAGNFTVRVTGQLRYDLRSNPASRAPANTLPAGPDHYWLVPNAAMGGSYIKDSGGDWKQVTVAPKMATASLQVNAGSAKSQPVLQVTPDQGTVLTSVQNVAPGNWVDFYAGLANPSTATGAVYGGTITFTVPVSMVFNPSGGHDVVVAPVVAGTVAPAGISASDVTCQWTTDNRTLTCTISPTLAINPGETFFVKIPVQLNDGTPYTGDPLTGTNLITGYGLNEPTPSACATTALALDALSSCQASATIVATDATSVRVENYIGAGSQGVSDGTGGGMSCDSTSPSYAGWGGASPDFYLDPCQAQASPGEVVTFRLKLINSGNNPVDALRFADVLPYFNDNGTIADFGTGGRGSDITATLVGPVTLINDPTIDDPAAYRADGSLTAQYSSAKNPCTTNDMMAGSGVLSCSSKSGTTWGASPATSTQAIKGEVTFPGGQPLQGGQYVIVEFQVKIPTTGVASGQVIVNDATIAGQVSGVWGTASSSALSVAKIATTSFTIVKHMNDALPGWFTSQDQVFVIGYDCQVGGSSIFTADQSATITLTAIDMAAGKTAVASDPIDGIPAGATCLVTSESWTPTGYVDSATAPIFGDSKTATGYTATFSPAIQVDGSNNLAVANSLNTTSVTLTQKVSGDAAGLLDAASFGFPTTMVCSMAGVDNVVTAMWPSLKATDGAQVVPDVPVGATCVVRQTGDNGANGTPPVTATVDGQGMAVTGSTDNWSIAPTAFGPATHSIVMTNNYDAADLTVHKTLNNPTGAMVEDMQFGVACTYRGADITARLGASQKTASIIATDAGASGGASAVIHGLPVGAQCTVTETGDGGVSNPDALGKTDGYQADIKADNSARVDFVNSLSGVSLVIKESLTGSATSPAVQPWLPSSFPVSVNCTRGGQPVTGVNGSYDVPVGGAGTVITGIPSGATCIVTQTDNRGALSTANQVGTSPADTGASLAVTVDDNTAVTFVNAFELASVTVTNTIAPADVNAWHLTGDESFFASYSCTVPGDLKLGASDAIMLQGRDPFTGTVAFDGQTVAGDDGTATATIDNLPPGSECEMSQVRYLPYKTYKPGTPDYHSDVVPNATDDSLAWHVTSSGSATAVSTPLRGSSSDVIALDVYFDPAGLSVKKVVQNDTAATLTGQRYAFAVTCTGLGVTVNYQFPIVIGNGETGTLTGGASGSPTTTASIVPGAKCTVTEVLVSQKDDGIYVIGAPSTYGSTSQSVVMADSADDTVLTYTTGVATLDNLPYGGHTLVWTNAYEPGGKLVIDKRLSRPNSSTAVGDFTFAVACTLNGDALELPYAAATITIPASAFAGANQVTREVSGLPAGAVCTVTETGAGGVDKPAAPVTADPVSSDPGTPVTALMANSLSGVALTLNETLNGTATTPMQPWVPQVFGLHVSCYRDLTQSGSVKRVQDYDGDVSVTVGSPVVIPDLPHGTTCVVSEADSLGAAATGFAALGGVALSSTADSATVTLQSDVALTVTHIFDVQSVDVTYEIADGPVDAWHMTGAEQYTVAYSCSVPANLRLDDESALAKTAPFTGSLVFDGPYSAGAVSALTKAIVGLPAGSVCVIDSVLYDPPGYQAPSDGVDFYGEYTLSGSGSNPRGYSVTSSGAITAGTDGAILLTATFAQTGLSITKHVDNQSVAQLATSPKFTFDANCFLDPAAPHGYPAVELADGQTKPVIATDGGSAILPVGATCLVRESDSAGATGQSAQLGNAGVDTNSQLRFVPGHVSLYLSDQASSHALVWTNTYAAGGSLVVNKSVVRPQDASTGEPTAVGDFTFAVACTLDGDELTLPSAVASFTIPAGKFGHADHASHTIAGLPAGVVCTVTETGKGGANDTVSPQPTIVIDAVDDVFVDMTNIYHPVELDLTAHVSGSAYDAHQPWVPAAWQASVKCGRQLTINGADVLVTDYDGQVSVTDDSVAKAASVVSQVLPVGSTCQISEPDTQGSNTFSIEVTAVPSNGLVTSYDDKTATATVVLPDPAVVTADLQFTYETTKLTIDETFRGSAPAGATMPFTLVAAYVDRQGIEHLYALPQSSVAFSLGHAGEVVIDVPLNAKVTVDQTTQKGSTVKMAMDGAVENKRTFTFVASGLETLDVTNTWPDVSTGGSLDGTGGPIGDVLAFMMIVTGAMLMIRRRQ